MRPRRTRPITDLPRMWLHKAARKCKRIWFGEKKTSIFDVVSDHMLLKVKKITPGDRERHGNADAALLVDSELL